jgi:hypothetical protein
MTRFVATVNVPGYLPMDDDPPTFDTAQEAWAYLAELRQRDEDQNDTYPEYTNTLEEMKALSNDQNWSQDEGVDWLAEYFDVNVDGTGTVYGATPDRIGPDGESDENDLGLAYTVSISEEPEPATAQGVLWVCVDCHQAAHGIDEHERGEPYPTDPRPWALWLDRDDMTYLEVAPGMLAEEHAEDCDTRKGTASDDYECECEHATFSPNPCDGCGSPLAGEREAATWWGGGEA